MMRLRRVVLVLAALTIGCSERNTKAPPAVTADAGAVVLAAPPDAAAAVDCSAHLGPLRAKVSSAYVAKDSVRPYQKAVELWPTVPEACRDGEWYVFAAKLIVWSGGSNKLEATGVVLESRDQALAEAVSRGLDANDLTYVATTAAAGGTTKLPADACAVAEAELAGIAAGGSVWEATRDAHYVCGHAALAAGDAATAKARFDGIEEPNRNSYPDLDLRLAEAELALGNKKKAKKLAKRVTKLDSWDARFRFVSSGDYKAIVAAAEAIAK